MKRFLWLVMIVSLLTGCAARPSPGRNTEPLQIPVQAVDEAEPGFPHTLTGGLTAERLSAYSGQYWEDGSGAQKENVAALLICNDTDQLLHFGAFAVEQDGITLYFFVHQLPPKSRCLVLEYGQKPCEPHKPASCRALSIRWEYPDFSRAQVDYIGRGQEMTVINRDGRTLHQTTVWYKRYDKEGECYIGGIAYAAYFYDMLPGERRSIRPEHYDAVLARIVGIEVEI